MKKKKIHIHMKFCTLANLFKVGLNTNENCIQYAMTQNLTTTIQNQFNYNSNVIAHSPQSAPTFKIVGWVALGMSNPH